jgi:hypothetical protein
MKIKWQDVPSTTGRDDFTDALTLRAQVLGSARSPHVLGAPSNSCIRTLPRWRWSALRFVR